MRGTMYQNIERGTDVLAFGAVLSYFTEWHEYIEKTSVEAALWLPILGAAWLIVQIVYKLAKNK